MKNNLFFLAITVVATLTVGCRVSQDGVQAADAELNRGWGSLRTRLKQAKEAIELECVSSSKVEFASQLLK